LRKEIINLRHGTSSSGLLAIMMIWNMSFWAFLTFQHFCYFKNVMLSNMHDLWFVGSILNRNIKINNNNPLLKIDRRYQ
jgi:hypothetical protein